MKTIVRRMMISGITLATFAATCLYGQTGTLDPIKPGVFLSYERAIGNDIVLRLTNNSPWILQLCSQAFYPAPKLTRSEFEGKPILLLKSNNEYKLCYGVQTYARNRMRFSDAKLSITKRSKKTSMIQSEKRLTYEYFSDFGGNVFLNSGDSILVRLPSSHLSENHSVYVTFRYIWETMQKTTEYRPVENRANFYDFQLDNQLQK